MVASEANLVDMTVHLLKAGADVNIVNSTGHTALAEAVNKNIIPIVQLLLNHGADTSITDIAGHNALFRAVHEGHVFMMDMLVKRGASITAVDNHGNTVLMSALSERQELAAEWLIQHGGVDINAANNEGFTALHTASAFSCSDDTAMVELLLANGADVHKRTVKGITALDVAFRHGKLVCGKLLIAAGAEINHGDTNGATTLHGVIATHLATAGPYSAYVAQFLLEHDETAVMNSAIPSVCLNGAACCTDQTALMMCSEVSIVKLQLAAGADVSLRTSSGNTCLHAAVAHELPVPIVCLLIKAGVKAGVDLNAVNLAGKTAADIAHDRGYTVIEQILNRAVQQQEH
jgi:ankyrin repeat protein